MWCRCGGPSDGPVGGGTMNDEDEKMAELLAQQITLLMEQKELLQKAHRPMKDGFVGMWRGEEWTDFHWAGSEISDALAIPFGPATARLRKLCAEGEVRAITSEENRQDEPELIPPSRWRAEDVDLAVPWDWIVAVCESDLRYWLNQQPVQPTSGGKQSRILRL